MKSKEGTYSRKLCFMQEKNTGTGFGALVEIKCKKFKQE